MDLLFAAESPIPADAVREQLVDPPSYSAVRAMLAKLEQKGHVQHTADGPRYVYSPTQPKAAARRSALERIVRVFFSGSPQQTATALLKRESWTDDELDELSAEIEALRKRRKRS